MGNRDISSVVVWGHCTIGQAIYIDGEIKQIARGLLD